jgi:SMC interacting uncharacterized protein involved in chromosome segregation
LKRRKRFGPFSGLRLLVLMIPQVTSTQKLASDAQIEKMERELAKMRAGLEESVQLMEQREMNTNIECVPV